MTWLRHAPECRCDGANVYVRFDLDPKEFPGGPRSLAWKAGDMQTTTPSTTKPSITCTIPRGVFENRTRVELQILGAARGTEPVFEWTQFPVLAESSFKARMDTGAPELVLEKQAEG